MVHRLRGVAAWRIAAPAAAALLYVVAVSNTAYELTSPLSLPHHVVFRKLYAVLAFTLIGFLVERSEIPRVRGFAGTALLIGLYSYTIELGQIVFDQSTETFFQHGFDVLSGVFGGALGSMAVSAVVVRRSLSPARLVALALLAVLVVVTFFPTYGTPQPVALAQKVAVTGPAVGTQLSTGDDSSDWILPAHSYDGNRYVRESTIDRGNVGRLRPAWIWHFPDASTVEAAPLEWQGTVYVTSGNDGVYAIDARTGLERWEYVYPVKRSAGLWVNRGAALFAGRVYLGTLDGRLIALDARDGHVLWNVQGMHDAGQHGYYAVAPVPYKNLILIGPSTGVWGGTGYVTAFSAATGKRVWEWYTIPRPGEPGHESWGSGDAWKTGGGSVWGGFTIDPATDTLYVDVGNPQPAFRGDVRRGSNLYSDSMVALDVSGPRPRVRWYHQFTPHDLHDWDVAAPPVLFSGEIRGVRRSLVATGDKVGNFWVLDPHDGKVLEHAVVSLQKNIDVAPRGGGVLTCPGTNGGVEYNGGSYLPETNAYYLPSLDQCATFAIGPVTNKEDGGLDLGGPIPIIAGPSTGWMSAIDVGSGQFLWRRKLALPEIGGALSLGSGLVFTGQLDGEFDAYDARTGDVLWKFATGSTIAAPPATYTLSGKQYIIVASGNPTGNFALPGLPATNAGAMISAFSLP